MTRSKQTVCPSRSCTPFWLLILREILQTLTGGSPRDEKLAAMLADAISRIQLQVNAVFDPREAGRALAPEVDKRQGGTAVLRERGVV